MPQPAKVGLPGRFLGVAAGHYNQGSRQMPKLTIIADIKANRDKIDLVKESLLSLIEPTRAERGCINYDLHQDNDDPAHFFFYENWESRDLWQDHMNSAHLAAHKAKTEGCIEAVVVSEMTVIG